MTDTPESHVARPDLATMADKDLLTAYQVSGGEAGDPEADALADEIWRRGLDV